MYIQKKSILSRKMANFKESWIIRCETDSGKVLFMWSIVIHCEVFKILKIHGKQMNYFKQRYDSSFLFGCLSFCLGEQAYTM